VGQKFARVGTKDIRKDSTGAIDFRMQRQLRCWKRQDAPPTRVKPVPITIIMHILKQACGTARHHDRQMIANITCVAFYYLLRPGECTGTTTDDQPFLLEDMELFLDDKRLNTMTAPLAEIEAATSVAYAFTTQKNGTRGEKTLHGRSGHHLCCPVKATIRMITYHRRHRSPPTAPIASYYTTKNRRTAIKAKDVTQVLQSAAGALRSTTGLEPKHITARSLRAGGAMALLCGQVDHNLIQMLGRWHSDAMMRHLHLQARPVMQHFAAKMFNHGEHSFQPDESVPMSTD